MKSQEVVHFCREQRYFLAPFLVVLCLGFYLDLHERLDLFYKMWDQEKQQTLEREEQEQALRQANLLVGNLRRLQAGKVKKPLLDQVIEAATLSRCSVTGLQAEFKNATTSAATGRVFIQLRLDGDYAGFYQFLETLLQRSLPVQVDHLSMKEQGEGLEIALQLSAFPWAYWMAEVHAEPLLPAHSCCTRDPFRDAPDQALTQDRIHKPPVEQFSLRELRYVGYVSEQGLRRALIVLPDGRCYDLSPGERLGTEAWLLLEIDPHYLTLGKPAQKQPLQWQRAG